MSESVSQPRLRTTLLALFSAVALVLSLIGVYGVMAYAVSERTHEIGVRIALGASPADIRSLVVGEGTRLAGVGIAIGIAGALVTSRALGRAAVRRQRHGSCNVCAAALFLAVAGVAAAYIPARRASRTDPVGAAAISGVARTPSRGTQRPRSTQRPTLDVGSGFSRTSFVRFKADLLHIKLRRTRRRTARCDRATNQTTEITETQRDPLQGGESGMQRR